MQFYGAIRCVLQKLRKELPTWLQYHDVDHVRDVYRMARFIGKSEGLSEYELKIVLTAAILHDSGFTVGNDKHEERSCEIARNLLPAFGYTPSEIGQIEKLIMATTIPHRPETLAEQVICDADLDYLGRQDFYERAEKLFIELQYQNIVKDRNVWNTIQEKFLMQHKYFTRTAIEARQSMKNNHLLNIQEELKQSRKSA